MPTLRGTSSSFRGYVPEEDRLISVLESDAPLPDDDPKTRRGGLDPSREQDISQIQMYAQLRQNGSISDKAWRRLIQRNPRASVLFSSIQTDPAISTARARQEIGSKYFNPGQEAVPFETTEEQEFGLPPLKGNIAQEAIAPKSDVQGAILESLNKGDIDFASKLGYGAGEKSEKNINSYNLALRAEGRETGDPRVDALDPDTAANVLARTFPPTVVQTTGGSIVAPRGQVPGKPGALPNFIPNPKDLSPDAIKELSEVSSAADQSRNLLGSFKDQFGGFKSSVVGNAVISYKSRFGDDGMAEWWNEYQAKRNLLRNKLFGGALTATERDEWEKADINPGMDPKLIRKNLARRAEIEKRAAAKIIRAYKAGSYNQAQVQAATEPSPERKSSLSETERDRLVELRKKQSAR